MIHSHRHVTTGVTPPINASDPPLFDRLASHFSHKIEMALYGNDDVGTVNVSVECVDCNEVLIDQERYPEEAL